MKFIRRLLRWFLCILLIPLLYVLVSLIFTFIPVNAKSNHLASEKTIYIATNGVHLEIILPKETMQSSLLSGIKTQASDRYFSFGWGEENFYLNTPTWEDLTLKNAFTALFSKSTTLLHITRYASKSPNWVEVNLSDSELAKLNAYLQDTFQTDKEGKKLILENQGYTKTDDFYRAKGSYSCFNTCNTWVNKGFKRSGLASCLWTPFDFGLIRKYK